MNDLTQEQLDKLKGIMDFAEKSDISPNLPLVEELQAIRKVLEALVEKEMPEMPKMPEVHKVAIEGIEVLTLKGDKGDDAIPPTDEHLVELITPLIPPPIKPKDGYTPKKGVDYFDGEPGVSPNVIDIAEATSEKLIPLLPKKEDIENDIIKSGEKIRDSIEKLEGDERLDKSAIKGLDDELKAIRALPRGGGASRRVFQPKRDDLSASCDGSNKTFYLSRAPLDEGIVFVFGTDFPLILRPEIDFTIANKTLTLTSAVPAPNTGATLLVSYFA